jgi:hypothetical protein
LDITGATNVDLNGASLTNGGITEGFDTIDVFEADGTFDASNVDKAFVECVGGGGGGGGFVDNGVDTVAVGGGGGGGGYAASYIDLSAESSVTITVGSGGTPETSGGDSSFGTFVVGNGGAGGTAADQNRPSGGSGGGGSGDITVSGGDGSDGDTSQDSYSTAPQVTGGGGGQSLYGAGAKTTVQIGNPVSGADGLKYGGGGGGAVNGTGGTGIGFSGGSGGVGIVIVYYKA